MKEYIEHLESNGRKVTICTLAIPHDVSQIEEDFSEVENEVVAAGVAICNPKDQYNRKKGNMIARGRAYKALDRIMQAN